MFKSQGARILKDIVVVCTSIALFYAVTHNPITHPKAETAPGVWGIEMHQHPLVLGLAGHNYLALRNDTGDILYELHGLPTDVRTGNWKYVGRTNYDILKVWEFSTSTTRTPNPNPPVSTTLISGDKNSILTLWQQARVCGKKIDKEHIPYPPYGISFKEDTRNSNSVAYTLSLCVGINPHHVGLLTPGWETDLLYGNYK
jgi:hypothetical protein